MGYPLPTNGYLRLFQGALDLIQCIFAERSELSGSNNYFSPDCFQMFDVIGRCWPVGLFTPYLPRGQQMLAVNFSRICDLLTIHAGYHKSMEAKKDSVDCVGFPSPAAPYMEGPLDLNEYLIKHPAATFFVRVNGDAMIGAGIHHEDILIVDRSLKPTDNKVVIAIIDGEFIVRRLCTNRGRFSLLPDNPNYQPIKIDEGTELEIWGVVTTVIHPL